MVMEVPESGNCDSCDNPCTNEEWCFGCRHFVCSSCSINWNLPWGSHDVDDHYVDPDEEEEEDD